MINIVRKDEHVQLLKEMGCEYVLNSSNSDFFEKLEDLATKLDATVCFEAVAGTLTGKILSCMPKNSSSILYGLLSEEDAGGIDPLPFLIKNQRIESFYLGVWFKSLSLWNGITTFKKAQKLMSNKTLHSTVYKRISLFELKDAIPEYKQNMTKGKYIIHL
jgi:NADPH2:quinone reductase